MGNGEHATDCGARFELLVSEFKRLRERRLSDEEAHASARRRAFEMLTAAARPRVLERLRHSQERVESWRRENLQTLAPFDLFAVLGIDGREASYTSALAWLLSPAATPSAHDIAAAIQAKILWTDMRPPAIGGPLLSATTEVTTIDGRVDLLLEFDDRAIVVETKVWTDEHATPSGLPQSEAYVSAVEALLERRGNDKPVFVVLLTPDGRAPLNPNAGALGFLPLAVAILNGVSGVGNTQHNTVALLFAEHLLEIAANAFGGSFRNLSRSPLDVVNDEQLLRQSANLAALTQAIERGAP
jgi:hypothetical protein